MHRMLDQVAQSHRLSGHFLPGSGRAQAIALQDQLPSMSPSPTEVWTSSMLRISSSLGRCCLALTCKWHGEIYAELQFITCLPGAQQAFPLYGMVELASLQ